MAALSVDSAKNIAIVVVIAFVVLSVVSAIVVKAIVTKIILVVLMGGLALGAWTQRQSLSECADKAAAAVQDGTAGAETVTCTFFGTEVDLPAP